MTPDQARRAMEILESMPEMTGCNGLCWRSCGPIRATVAEVALIQDANPLAPEPGIVGDMMCVYLTPAKRCSVYAERPLICRLWGANQKMPCPWGCVPERWVSDEEFADKLRSLEALLPGPIVSAIMKRYDRDGT